MPEDDIQELGTEEASEQEHPTTEKPAKDPDKWIPKHRFDQVNEKLKDYTETGLSAGDIREMVGEYRALVDKVGQRPAEAKPTKQSTIDDARRKELRDGLLEVMPELGDIPGLLDEVKKTKATATVTEQQQIQALNDKAMDICKDLFIKEGYDMSSKYQKLYDRLELGIANDIYTDPDKRKRFYRGDMGVVRETFKEHAEDVLAHVVKPAKQSTKDLSFMSGKKGLSLPASPLDDKLKGGKPLTRDELKQMYSDTFSHMQTKEM